MTRSSGKRWLRTLALFLLLLAAARFTDCSPTLFWARRSHLTDLISAMLPPDWGYAPRILAPLLATVQMSVTGTALGSFLALLLAPTFANHFWNKGGWIQNRANTLALWCMFAQVFPLFQDDSVFSTITSVYANGFMDPAVRPTAANPTAQGVISIVALVVNVVILASIIKRAKAQKKNPYKQEIFTDQRDFREAMERA